MPSVVDVSEPVTDSVPVETFVLPKTELPPSVHVPVASAVSVLKLAKLLLADPCP